MAYAPRALLHRETHLSVAVLPVDTLQAEGGFDDLFHKFAPAFKASFQGPGHEVGHWQAGVPGGPKLGLW